ncbi:immunity 49 family protein [Pseudoalteromonas sp. SWXJZ94C]|uniref:immunity 49 family protein n=1 Tax=Pseudoalteromonas sp. SWXJZ94C TaxID=2792065 RepID=UPI0018CE7775|nr:immunity 49 family protein [Pseudoalteromonas sp. SWXJZ94C]MBH0059222.1 immunity 49 family protein [Pseudoalteromonas sp. SWXJZ94C]
MIERHYKETHMELVIKDINRFEKRIPRKINTIKNKNSGEVLGSSIQHALHAFADSVLAEFDHSDQLRYLMLLKEFGTTNFEFVMRVDETFPVIMDGETFELTGAHKTDFVDTGHWEKAFYSAVILRDRSAIHSLRDVEEIVFLNANLKCNSFDLALVNIMQNLFTGGADMGDLLEKALLADDPDYDRLPYSSHILLPLIAVYRCIFTPDAEAEFNSEMRDALEKHKVFWKKQNSMNKEGWISLPLIAAAAFAYDRNGYKLDFETDYIPDWLVKGEFMNNYKEVKK